MSEVVL